MDENSITVKNETFPSGQDPKNERRCARILAIFEYLEILTGCLLVILLVYSCNLRICRVSGDSMLPTLQNDQVLLVCGVHYQPQCGDIVVFHQINEQDSTYNETIVKRVIAVSGQLVRIDFNRATVSVDGVVLEEDYIQLLGQSYAVRAEHHMVNGVFEAVVPDGCVFVMGDNRNRSLDSRSSVIGFVDQRRILGKVVTRLTPLELFGSVD